VAPAREALRLELSLHTGGHAIAGGQVVAVHLPDGTPVGNLWGVPLDGAMTVGPGQLEGMTLVAELIGRELDEERTRERRRSARQVALRRFLSDGGTSVVLQPIRRLGDGEPVGYEALSRFTGDAIGTQTTDAVFAEAHALGLGVELELPTAGAALELSSLVPAPCYLSVNLSPAALLDERTYERFARVEAGRVVLELTEHEQVEDYAALRDALAGLRSRGVRLAVDDAGAGFASLQHISRLSPDLVKLDRTLIRAVHDDPSHRAVVRAMVQFAQETGASLVAEGIEEEAERRQLEDLGVELGQGFLLGRPAEPRAWLRQHRSSAATVPRQRRPEPGGATVTTGNPRPRGHLGPPRMRWGPRGGVLRS